MRKIFPSGSLTGGNEAELTSTERAWRRGEAMSQLLNRLGLTPRTAVWLATSVLVGAALLAAFF